jgi:hypothetical protein
VFRRLLVRSLASEPIQPWHGPAPQAHQRWLLEACLAPSDAAVRAWQQWLEHVDFDQTDAASHELASFAVLRLGAAAGDGSVVQRCRGLQRRAWVVSQLGLEVAAQVAAGCRDRGETMLARGDLAMSLLGVSFMGRSWPVRALSFGVAPGGNSLAKHPIALVGDGVAGDVLRNGRLSIGCRRSPRPLWKHAQPAPKPWEGLRVPPLPWLLADQVTLNWCWDPPGRLRWVLELIDSLKQAPDPEALADGIVLAASQLGSLAALRAATDDLATLSGSQALEPLGRKLRGLHLSRRSRWRLAAVTAEPTSLERRGLRLLDQLRTRLAL